MSQIPPEPPDRPNRIPWPPIADVTVLVLAWALGRLLPLDVIPASAPLKALGWLLLAAGIAVAVAGFGYFKQIGTPVDPTGQALKLATGGIYRLTRNPMYLGTVTALLGLAIVFASSWLLLLTMAMPFVLWKLAISREEAYLSSRFGNDYDAYRAQVRRWL